MEWAVSWCSPYILIIKVRARFFNRFYALKLCSMACFVNQRLTRADAKTLQKKCFADLVGMEKSSTFAPAIERDAAVIEILKVKLGSSNHSKNFFKKIF